MTSLVVSSCDDAILSAGRKVGENSNRKFRVVEDAKQQIFHHYSHTDKRRDKGKFSDWKPIFFLCYCKFSQASVKALRDKKIKRKGVNFDSEFNMKIFITYITSHDQ